MRGETTAVREVPIFIRVGRGVQHEVATIAAAEDLPDALRVVADEIERGASDEFRSIPDFGPPPSDPLGAVGGAWNPALGLCADAIGRDNTRRTAITQSAGRVAENEPVAAAMHEIYLALMSAEVGDLGPLNRLVAALSDRLEREGSA